MKQTEVENARRLVDFGFAPPQIFASKILDQVSENSKKVFRTHFMQNISTGLYYIWLNCGRFNNGFLRSYNWNMVMGGAKYDENLSLPDALKTPPEMNASFDSLEFTLSGDSSPICGADIKHTLSIAGKPHYTVPNPTIDGFLSREYSPIIIVPDQLDKEVFAFVIDEGKGNGYSLFRMREKPGTNI